MPHASRKPAFTIVELLAVIVIIAAVAGGGVGFYSGPYRQMLVQKAARDVFLAARYARNAAIEQQKPHRLVISRQERLISVVAEERDEATGRNGDVAVSNQWQRPVEIAEDVIFEVIDIDRTNEHQHDYSTGMETVTFRPDGTAQRAAIQLGDGKRHYVVSISAATGKATFLRGTIDEIVSDTFDLDDHGESWRTGLEARYE